MAVKIVCKVVPGGLMCANNTEADKLEDLKGQEVMATITRPRNLPFHRKFFALLGVARDMARTEANPEQFRHMVLAGAGWCDFVQTKSGKLVAVPKSISFAAMDDVEFQKLYSDCMDFICKEWVMDSDQIDQIVGFM